jgi:hypothetical protein
MPKYIVYILWDRLASAHTVLTRLVFAILVFALFVFAHLVFAHFCFRPLVFALLTWSHLHKMEVFAQPIQNL